MAADRGINLELVGREDGSHVALPDDDAIH